MSATNSVVDGIYVMNVTKPGTANWHIVDQQLNIPLIQGETYTITFECWSENPNTMDVFPIRLQGFWKLKAAILTLYLQP